MQSYKKKKIEDQIKRKQKFKQFMVKYERVNNTRV